MDMHWFVYSRKHSIQQRGHVLNDYFNRTNLNGDDVTKNIITQKNTCLTSGGTNITKFFPPDNV